MDSILTDHTSDVERRLAAICVKPRDGCAFFRQREDSLVKLRECWYCAFGNFDKEGKDLPTQGYCNYKK